MLKKAPRMVPEGSRGLPGTPLEMHAVSGLLFSSILAPIWLPFGFPFDLHFGAFFHEFPECSPGGVPGGPGPDFGAGWPPFWNIFSHHPSGDEVLVFETFCARNRQLRS